MLRDSIISFVMLGVVAMPSIILLHAITQFIILMSVCIVSFVILGVFVMPSIMCRLFLCRVSLC